MSPRRSRALALAVVAVVLATVVTGCVGVLPGNDRGDGGAFLSVERAAAPTEGAAVVDCEALTDDQRAAFDRAAGAPDGTAEVDGVGTEPFVEHEYVRCDGRHYRVAVAVP